MINREDVILTIGKQTSLIFDPAQEDYSLLIRLTMKRVIQKRDILLQVDCQGDKNFKESFKMGHEIQALGYEVVDIKIAKQAP